MIACLKDLWNLIFLFRQTSVCWPGCKVELNLNQNGNGCFHFQDYSVQSMFYCCLGIKRAPIRQDLHKCVYNVTHKKESEETYW